MDFDPDVESGWSASGDEAVGGERTDEVAYVRFASVYRRFKDVQDFVDELADACHSPPARGIKG